MKKEFRLIVKGTVYDLRTFKDMESAIIDRKFSIDFQDMKEYESKFKEQVAYALSGRIRNDVKGDYHVSLDYKNYFYRIVMKPSVFNDDFVGNLYLNSLTLVRESEEKLDKMAAELSTSFTRSLYGK